MRNQVIEKTNTRLVLKANKGRANRTAEFSIKHEIFSGDKFEGNIDGMDNLEQLIKQMNTEEGKKVVKQKNLKIMEVVVEDKIEVDLYREQLNALGYNKHPLHNNKYVKEYDVK